MFVVWNTCTGWSDETMRFGSRKEAQDWIIAQGDSSNYDIREED